MLGSVTDGEALVKETLLRAYEAIDTLCGPSRLEPWLFQIAHNLALDRLRNYEHRNIERFGERESELESTLPGADSPDTQTSYRHSSNAMHAPTTTQRA